MRRHWGNAEKDPIRQDRFAASKTRESPQRDVIRRRDSPVDPDFPVFSDKLERVSYKSKPPREERERPAQSKKAEDKFTRVQQDIGLIDKLEALISAYDQNHTQRCQRVSNEYQHRVISPLQSRLKEQFTGGNYRRRRKMMQPDAREPPHNIESLVIKTKSQDHATKRKREGRHQQALEETVTGRVHLEIIPEYNRPFDNKAARDTRFFDGGGNPRKGTKVFDEKYRSSIGAVVRDF